jgi:hypothetical protein
LKTLGSRGYRHAWWPQTQLTPTQGASALKNAQGWDRYKELTKMRGQLSGQLASLMTKLRLTPQSRVHRYVAGTQAHRRAGRPPPWAPVHDGDPMCG